MTDHNPRNGHDTTAAALAGLTERVKSLCEHQKTQDAQIAALLENSRKVAQFVDECTGGRKAMLLLLKSAGIIAGVIGVGWAIFHAMWKAKVGA